MNLRLALSAFAFAALIALLLFWPNEQRARRLEARVAARQDASREERLAAVVAEEARLLEALGERRLRSILEGMEAPEEVLESYARLRRSELREEARTLATLRGREIGSRLADAEAQGLAALGEEAAVEERHALLRALLACVATATLAILASRWLLQRRLIQPLRKLGATMDELAEGASHRSPMERGGETASLVSSFNRMADALVSSRDGLQDEVDRKTAALARGLEEQRALNRRLEDVLQELESTQAQLVRNEKLAAIGTLASGVAHEFNNVLGGIRGCTQALRDDVEDAELLETIAVILRATERGRKIVDGLQSFGRSPTPHPKTIDAMALVRELLRGFEPRAQQRGVSVLAEGDAPCRAWADPELVQQVVSNLLSNALSASPPGTTIRVSAIERDDGCAISVSDEGEGVPDALRSRIFEPFFTTREREGGSGLGLAISHGIARALEGSLEVDSAPGGGACFVLQIPARSTASAADDSGSDER